MRGGRLDDGYGGAGEGLGGGGLVGIVGNEEEGDIILGVSLEEGGVDGHVLCSC